jgi:hypothetical protein
MLTSNKFSVLFAFFKFPENSHQVIGYFTVGHSLLGILHPGKKIFFFFSTLNTTSYCVCQLRVGGRLIYIAGHKIVISLLVTCYSLQLLLFGKYGTSYQVTSNDLVLNIYFQSTTLQSCSDR